jgi:rubrerythrin
MSDIQERLRILLDYWIEHNSEHEKEFRDWAGKAAFLHGEVAQQLQEAATKMAGAGNDLMKAREALTKKMEGR